MAKQEFHLDFCGRGITVETGEIAKQADGAVIIRYGDTVTIINCYVPAIPLKRELTFSH